MSYTTLPRMRYGLEEVWFPLSEDILAWDDDFHDLMLNDALRMTAYERAIKEVVRDGMVVADIGTGTGILALWALQAGARKVYGIEINKNRVRRAIDRIREAGFEEKFEIINKISYEAELPERADLIISEILGNLGDNEDMVRILNDARKRFLKPDGKMLPRSVGAYLVPVESIELHKQVATGNVRTINDSYNIEILFKKLGVSDPFNIYYDSIIPASAYLSSPALVRSFSFDGSETPTYETTHEFKVARAGVFAGFKGYFIAQLSDTMQFDISGDDIDNNQTSDCLKHCYLPIRESFAVLEGDVIVLNWNRHYPAQPDSPFRQCYSWSGAVVREGTEVHRFNQHIC